MRNTKLIRRPRTRELTGLSDSTIDRLEREGQFPQRIRITQRTVGWVESDVQEWIANRIHGGIVS